MGGGLHHVQWQRRDATCRPAGGCEPSTKLAPSRRCWTPACRRCSAPSWSAMVGPHQQAERALHPAARPRTRAHSSPHPTLGAAGRAHATELTQARPSFLVTRTGLAQQLVAQAEALAPDAITFMFGATLESIDFAGRRAVAVQHQVCGRASSSPTLLAASSIPACAQHPSPHSRTHDVPPCVALRSHPCVWLLRDQPPARGADGAAALLRATLRPQGTPGERRAELAYDLLVGADGAGSRTRQLMQVRRGWLHLCSTPRRVEPSHHM